MVEHVLLPVDGSEHSDRACEEAFEMFPDAAMHLLYVISPADTTTTGEVATFDTMPTDWYENERDRAEQLFDTIESRSSDHSFERAVVVGQPKREILRYIEDNDIDHVVMGSTGREGVSRLLLGSVAESVARRSPVPVTITR
jgi:nucleotide-binding universal stress UspA family protein